MESKLTPAEIIEKGKKEIWHIRPGKISTDFDNRILEVIPELESILILNGSYIHITDATKMNFAYIGESIEPVLGYSLEEWEKKGTYFAMEIYCHDDVIATKIIHDHILAHIYSLPEEERIHFRYTDTFRLKHKNGHYIWLLTHLICLSFADDNKPHMILSHSTDITHIKNNNDILFLISKYIPSKNRYETLETQIYKADGTEALSEREKEVLRHLAGGLNNEEIAASMSLSVHTIRDHRRNMLHKTDINNSCQLLSFALNSSMI